MGERMALPGQGSESAASPGLLPGSWPSSCASRRELGMPGSGAGPASNAGCCAASSRLEGRLPPKLPGCGNPSGAPVAPA